MSELFPMFDESPAPQPPVSGPVMMTAAQRDEIKALFGQLGVTAAREQFAVIEEVTGTRINSVSELSAAHAHRAIAGLTRRVASLGETRTGNSWDDRDSPTWIDRL